MVRTQLLVGAALAALGASAAGQVPPRLAVVATVPGEASSTLGLVDLASERWRPLATFDHLPDAVVRGTLLRDRAAAAVVADLTPGRDRSWGSALWLVEPGRARLLADRVFFASRPLVTSTGRLFVERGRPGPPLADRLRVDELSIDEVAWGGTTRAVYQGRGFTAHLAAALGDELILYRVGPEGADLAVLDPDRGRLRVVTRIAPLARDFSLDAAGRLVFSSRRGSDWTIERLDLHEGAVPELLWRGARPPVPHAWPNDRRTLSADGRWTAHLWQPAPNVMPEVSVVDTTTSQRLTARRPPRTRFEIVGFVDDGAWR